MIDNSSQATLSVVIPCYNEINTIEQLILNVKKSPVNPKQIIIIDNCSNDGTREFLRDLYQKTLKNSQLNL